MAIHRQGKVILVVLFLPHKKNRDDARLSMYERDALPDSGTEVVDYIQQSLHCSRSFNPHNIIPTVEFLESIRTGVDFQNFYSSTGSTISLTISLIFLSGVGRELRI
ncbi:hypothetical protein [Chlorobium limicola]|uniref:Uncharacterized protein n=1 Tax=Chlorobium limicola TaxID=1092 RepID=A0A101JNZ2_CHLLI|nr:hypothetical protein [Chlorobium limicola]KUL30374.1 hypothetical protein ASB62_04250 [Chlorobium limicola]